MTLSPDSTASLISPQIQNVLNQSTPLQLGIMASGNGSNFEAVAQAIKDGQLNAQIQVLIYNNPDAYAAVRASNWNIPAVLLNHRDYSSRQEFDRQIVQTLRQYNVDWVIMAGWMRLVTEVLIDAFTNKIINIHPSLLPSFKGSRAVEQALASGVKIAGCTVHLVSLEMDSGPILMQAAVPVLQGDTPETLHARIQVQEHRILPQAIALAAKQAL
ncbi:phosphoribosylglycinamide formyltransferase [Fischerella thermalis]|jgi:phosphoribosylglycinamide formyltransferase-1|uniref:Phosphoribosylglycinamide formyltransferase n=3 Tax=Fischerella TaxID=1190 RepID=G6FUQ3_9CYAN|nr:phosphoribosylglycinamide formyltransferase [Fischerella thermalis]PMB07414.1 phosphoribosylglycinamide formyltransferase [Fischerella thermalis CCMEE 5273]PMB08006.1 phosphoribosylglycinamide formyltransferase [Fischerella thermalis CCMEE 5328]EHC12983.1 phosphoribosylglycinamide formyltransferase [Fischerella thermalis JSC-11]MBF1990993.1 phosphoribosylglycinamide formyltransferase [Fischerella thermalis M58_A2018_009]MBF2060036.1 phosphoribosylglycinamide formyltransferase [Fischerella t